MSTNPLPQSPGGAADMMAGITTVHFAIIAVFAVITVIAILWGMKLKRQRTAALDQVEHDRVAVADAAPVAVTPPPVVHEPPPPARLAEEPVATATPRDASAATAKADIVPAPPMMSGGDIMQLKGLGPKLAAQLAELGVTRVDQIAAMSPADVAALDARLGVFKGRIVRDRWVEQAILLGAGDKAAYEAEFGKLGG